MDGIHVALNVRRKFISANCDWTVKLQKNRRRRSCRNIGMQGHSRVIYVPRDSWGILATKMALLVQVPGSIHGRYPENRRHFKRLLCRGWRYKFKCMRTFQTGITVQLNCRHQANNEKINGIYALTDESTIWCRPEVILTEG